MAQELKSVSIDNDKYTLTKYRRKDDMNHSYYNDFMIHQNGQLIYWHDDESMAWSQMADIMAEAKSK